MKNIILFLLVSFVLVACSDDDSVVSSNIKLRDPSEVISFQNDKYQIFYGFIEYATVQGYNELDFTDQHISLTYSIDGGGLYDDNYSEISYYLSDTSGTAHTYLLKEQESNYWRSFSKSESHKFVLEDTLYSAYYVEGEDFYYDGVLINPSNMNMGTGTAIGYTFETLDISYIKNDTTHKVSLVPGLSWISKTDIYHGNVIRESKLLNARKDGIMLLRK